MILFWFSLLFLSLLACSFLITPLWQRKQLNEDKQRIENKTWYEDQLKSMYKALAEKKIDQAFFDQEYLTLQKDFLLFQHNTFGQVKTHTHHLLAILLACTLSIATFLLYQKLGASKILAEQFSTQKENQKIDQNVRAMGGTQGIINKLKQQLTHHPEDAQGWYLLGRIYFHHNQFNAAKLSFEKASQLAPNRQDIMIELVEASYLSADNKTASRLHQALQQMPQDPTLLNISALMLYQQKKYQQAITIWQNLLLQIPANSDTEKMLKEAIARAEKKLAGI